MEKVQVSPTETTQQDASTSSTVDQQSIPPIESCASSTEKLEEDVKIIDEEPVPETAEEEKKRIRREKMGRILTFVGLQIALFLAALDNTIVATSLPHIGSDFNRMSIVSWVATAYIITFDAFQPMFSKFSDIFGRKYILMFGIMIFLFASVLCGTAQNMIWLIVNRAVAGIGAAAIFSMVFIIFSDIVPLEQRGSYQGVINAVFALSSVFGPLIGGSLTDNVSWRWNFYINLPIGATAMVVLIFFLRLPIPKGNFREKLGRVDYAGTVIVLAFATLFLLALNFGGQTFPWKSAAVIVPLVLSFVLIGLLVIVERKFAKEPLLPPRLFKNRSVVAIITVNWFMGMSFFSAIYFLPIYFQVVRNDSAMWSGIRLIPMQMVLTVGSTIAGLTISKKGAYRPFIWLGTVLLTVWIGLISMFNADTPFSQIYGCTVIGGAGLGCLFTSTIIGLQASVSPKDIAVVTGLGNFSRILGGALGVAIASAVLNSELTAKLPEALPAEIAYAIIQSSEYVNHGLPEQYKEVTLEIYVQALQLIWYVLIPMAGLGFTASLFVKHHSVRSHKKIKEAAEAAAAAAANAEKAAAEDITNEKEVVVVEIPNKEVETEKDVVEKTDEHVEKKEEISAV